MSAADHVCSAASSRLSRHVNHSPPLTACRVPLISAAASIRPSRHVCDAASHGMSVNHSAPLTACRLPIKSAVQRQAIKLRNGINLPLQCLGSNRHADSESTFGFPVFFLSETDRQTRQIYIRDKFNYSSVLENHTLRGFSHHNLPLTASEPQSAPHGMSAADQVSSSAKPPLTAHVP